MARRQGVQRAPRLQEYRKARRGVVLAVGPLGLGEKRRDRLAARDALPRQVDPVEEIFPAPSPSAGQSRSERCRAARPSRIPGSRASSAPSAAISVCRGAAEEGVVGAQVDRDASRGGGRSAGPGGKRKGVEEEPARLPRGEALGDLLREPLRIAGRRERFDREDRRGRVVPVPSLAGRQETVDDDVRTERPEHADDVGEDLFPIPNCERLVRTFRVPEVDGAGEELLRPVDPPRREKLLGPKEAEKLGQFRSDEILAAVAARGCARLRGGAKAAPASATGAASAPAAPKATQPTEPVKGTPLTDPPPEKIEAIIREFAGKEELFKEARNNYTYHQINKVQEMGPDGEVAGTYEQDWDILFDDSGKRIEQVTYAPVPTLQRLGVTQEDLDAMRNIQPFVMTTSELPDYDVKYLGHVKVDELTAYVFSIRPKEIKKGRLYFQGTVWVDDRDLQIVKSEGKSVPEQRAKQGQENLFPRFTTYREQIDGKYWFPTYTMADDTLYFSSGGVRVKQVIRYTDYRQFKAKTRIITTAPVDQPNVPPPKP